MFFSLIIPVYHRSDEVDELLLSLPQIEYHDVYEKVIIEDVLFQTKFGSW